METKIEKACEIGFCFGVRRAINILEKAVAEHGSLETLGAVVHNEQVTQRLRQIGITSVHSLDEIKSNVVAISSHGVSPQTESELKSRVKVIDTTCPFVKRAQIAARRMAQDGFWVVVFGETQHSEVKGILGWTQGKGIATLDTEPFKNTCNLPRRLGILSQTTQIPENFINFVKQMIDLTLTKDVEIRIIDTICHDIRKRQSSSLDLANKVDLMLVIGGQASANTKRLMELCSSVTETHLISEAEEIKPFWLEGKQHIGITSGTSTSDRSIQEVVDRLEHTKLEDNN